MNDDLKRTLNSVLRDNERLLWEGMPAPGIHLSAEDAFLIPFSLLWCGFAVFWELSTFAMGAPTFFSLFGLPFVAVGLYLVFGRFLHAAWKAKHTGYAVTDQRIIIIERSGVTTLPVDRIPSLELRSHRNGLGTIYLESQSYYRRNGNRCAAPRKAFLHIENPHEVYRLIDSLMNS